MMMGRYARRNRVVAAIGLVFLCVVASGAAAQETTEVMHFASPFLMTAAGQTPDVLMVKIVAERSQLTFTYKALADGTDLAGKETLMLVMGVSMKGLGSAGIRLDEEIARARELINAARDAGLSVIGVFAGGAGGRGGRDQLTDSLLEAIAPETDYLLVIKTGDRDGFLKGIAEANGIPLTYMNTIVDMTTMVPRIFQEPGR